MNLANALLLRLDGDWKPFSVNFRTLFRGIVGMFTRTEVGGGTAANTSATKRNDIRKKKESINE